MRDRERPGPSENQATKTAEETRKERLGISFFLRSIVVLCLIVVAQKVREKCSKQSTVGPKSLIRCK